jgi:abortive infection bacteriophage resistance protein
MSNPARINYGKPWLSVADQLAKLRSRGLVVNNQAEALDQLGHLNYYRFSGYCLAFQTARNQFRPGTTFEDVLSASIFDAHLRDAVTDALELVEIDLRTVTAYHFGNTYGAFGHTFASNFRRSFDNHYTHTEWLTKLHVEAKRSSELFIGHFSRTYLEFPNLPIWSATEIMSFGGLSRMISGMHKADRRSIASQYRISAEVLAGLTHHLAYVRNICAHHCRLWDKQWKVKPTLPDSAEWRPPFLLSNDRIFATLLLIRTLMRRSPATKLQVDAWRTRVNELLTNPPNAISPQRKLGLSAGWTNHPAWV